MKRSHISLSASVTLTLSCVAATAAQLNSITMADLKAMFERDLEIEYPDDNPISAAKIELGKTLFFDPRLSLSGSQSCATCHNPSLGWGDGLALGVGHDQKPLERRSPTILNTAWSELLMWDGRADGLEEQALGPLTSPAEMNMSIELMIERLSGIERYEELFAAAFDGDIYVSAENVAKALASFQRTVVSSDAPFDMWLQGNEAAISDSAKHGLELFVGKANCVSCHEGWRFTDDSFYDIGLAGDDLGRGALLPNILSMQYAFKTPGLRNIDQRGPFMHDGSVATLTEVVQHYNDGGIARPSRSEEIYPLGLSDAEVEDIVAFLHTLTSDDAPVTLPILPR